MYKIAENELVMCPYNRSHVVSKLRIQKHIIKCKQQHPEIKLATCFYNYSHKLKPENILEHYETCPNKARVEGARYYDNHPNSVKNKYKPFSWYESYGAGNNSRLSPINSGLESNDEMLNFKEINEGTEPAGVNDFNDEVNPKVEELDSSSDDNIEPLPLPQTTSKAFTGFGRNSNDMFEVSSELSEISSESRRFGRGIQMFLAPPKKFQETPNKKCLEANDSDNCSLKKFLFRSCKSSEKSDDSTTIRSEDIIHFDSDDESSILSNFDKYVKV